jgi:hypothetical protein
MSCAAVAVCGSALAVPLAPGGQVTLGGTTTLENSWIAGMNQSGTESVFFTITDAQGGPVFQGTFTSQVTRSTALETMRVIYRLRDMQAIGNRAVSSVEIAGYSGFLTNVDFSHDSLGDVGPSAASRSASGGMLNFVFSPVLVVSQDSHFFWAHTDAVDYALSGQARITLNTGESVVIGDVYVPRTDVGCAGDVNLTGAVNFTDLNEVLSAFGSDCN